MLINRSGAMVLPFMSIYLNQELGLDLKKCSIIMSCFGVGSVLGAYIGGVLTDKIGFYRVMLYSLFATSIAFLSVMQLQTFKSLCIGIFFISFIADLFRPANLTAIEAFSKPENLTRSIGLIRLAINLGYAFGPFMGGYVASLMGYDLLFVLNALSVASAGICFYIFFRKKKKRVVRTKIKDEVEIIKRPLQDGSYLGYLILWCCVVVVFFQLIYVVPLYYKTELGFDESFVGILMALNGLLIFFIEMPLIYKIEKYLKPISFVVIGAVLIAVGVAFLGFRNQAYLAAFGFIIFVSMGEILSFPFSNTFALSFTQDNNRGKYMGLYTMTFSLAHIVSPMWLNFAQGYGYMMTWVVSASICIFAAGGIYLYKLRQA